MVVEQAHRRPPATGAGSPRTPWPRDLRPISKVADSVLYEGYLLYPYRRSSPKNRVRWQFGVLAPRCWAEEAGPADTSVSGSVESWWQQTECLVEAAEDAPVHFRVRFLQVQDKRLEEVAPGGGLRPVDRLEAGGRVELAFEEAVPREHDFECTVGEALHGERSLRLDTPGGEEVETLRDGGREVGRVVRSRLTIVGATTVSATPALLASPGPRPVVRLRLRIENRVPPAGLPPDQRSRPAALRRSMVATHCLLAVAGGRFLSLLEPPAWAGDAAKACRNVHTFPVLAGEPGSQDDLLLSSPIILYDRPQVAPESPGDLFDAAEIDEILSLRTLTLTDEEKREARATDPRAGELVDRVGSMPPEALARLHGTMRRTPWAWTP